MLGDCTWRREDGDAIVLALHVQPGAARTEVAGMHGDALKIRLAAPPVEGRANAELRRFLAAEFGVPLARATLVRGEASRRKTVRIERPARRPGWCFQGAALPAMAGSSRPSRRTSRA